jgi:hypothetical protein
MDFDDVRWNGLEGGYRTPYDPRNALRLLEERIDTPAAWDELWNELHHQGDVGEASYAAVPHLVRIYSASGSPHWNTYSMVATIDLARRNQERNPSLPPYLTAEYDAALRQLAELGLRELPSTTDKYLVRSILAILAIWKQQFVLADLAADFDDEELTEILETSGLR